MERRVLREALIARAQKTRVTLTNRLRLSLLNHGVTPKKHTMNHRNLTVAVLAAVLSLPVALVGAEEKKKGGGFAALDTDKDGKVSKKEFVAAHKDASKGESRFAQLDTDKDGFLTQAEMAAGQKKKDK